MIVGPLGALSPLSSAGLLTVLAAGCAGTAERTVPFVTHVKTAIVENNYYFRSYFKNKRLTATLWRRWKAINILK